MLCSTTLLFAGLLFSITACLERALFSFDFVFACFSIAGDSCNNSDVALTGASLVDNHCACANSVNKVCFYSGVALSILLMLKWLG